MAFENYEGTRPYSAAIRAAAQNRSMPPWACGKKELESFRMTCSLTEEQIALFRGMGRSQFSRWQSNRCAAEEEMGGSVGRFPAPDLEIKMAEPVNISGEWRRRLRIRNSAHAFQGRPLGAGLRNSARPAGACAPRGGLCTAPPDSPWLRACAAGKSHSPPRL